MSDLDQTVLLGKIYPCATIKAMECPLCAIVSSDSDEIIVEDTQHWRVALDPNQEYLGKVFVSLRRHKSTLSELTEEEWQEFGWLVGQLEPAIAQAFSPTHFNWSCLMNNAIAGGQPTHVHWHGQPRYKKPVEFAGESFVDSRWPEPARTVNEHIVSPDILRRIKQAIVEQLKSAP